MRDNRYSNQNSNQPERRDLQAEALAAGYTDKTVGCRDCKTDFLFTAKDQMFYAEKQYTPPKSCKPCRDERKARRNDTGGGQTATPMASEPVREETGRGRGKGGRRDRDDFGSDDYDNRRRR